MEKEITHEEVQKMIREECDSIKELLLMKNAMYGNSVISPKRIFSQAPAMEQLMVRIDDKLSRIANIGPEPDKLEDSTQDLVGYLILLRIAQRINK